MEAIHTGGCYPAMKLHLNLDEDLSSESGLVHIMVGDMFNVEVEVCPDGTMIAEGRERDVWAWLGFHLLEWEAHEA